jgi:hypothetical protein
MMDRRRLKVGCLHCGGVKSGQHVKLCVRCFRNVEICRRYRTPAYVDKMKAPLPPRPTSAAPGSLEKIKVLTARASLGQSLFHPDDATHDSR